MTLALKAMQFARKEHADQKRKYTGEPYVKHLAEVAGLVAALPRFVWSQATHEEIVATAWLHDYLEDCVDQDQVFVALHRLESEFSSRVASGVMWLSDLNTGTRKERSTLTCERLARAPGWVKTIKCADIISNVESIVLHDPKFAKVYLNEKSDLLAVLQDGAHPVLWNEAKALCHHGLLQVYSS